MHVCLLARMEAWAHAQSHVHAPKHFPVCEQGLAGEGKQIPKIYCVSLGPYDGVLVRVFVKVYTRVSLFLSLLPNPPLSLDIKGWMWLTVREDEDECECGRDRLKDSVI